MDSKLERLTESIKVYNLEVEDYHTYFVDDVPILVHNYKKVIILWVRHIVMVVQMKKKYIIFLLKTVIVLSE